MGAFRVWGLGFGVWGLGGGWPEGGGLGVVYEVESLRVGGNSGFWIEVFYGCCAYV